MLWCIRVKALKHLTSNDIQRKMSAQHYYNNTSDRSTQMSIPKNSPNLSMLSSIAPATIPAFPTVQQQLSQQPVYQTSYQPIQFITQQLNQPVQQASVYFLNDIPYYCYQQHPDILYPVYVPDFSHLQNQNGKPRVLGEMVSAVGDVLDNQFGSLENYVNNMEQQQIAAAQEKIKSSCFSCLC